MFGHPSLGDTGAIRVNTHSIVPSARTNTDGGIVRPSALAVFKLMEPLLWELSDRSQPKQPSQNQIDRDKIIHEARHYDYEDQYAENHGEGPDSGVRSLSSCWASFTTMMFRLGAAPYGVAVRSGRDSGVPIAVEMATRRPVIQ